MFRNYLAAALRNLLRNRAVTLINVGGLAIGFAAALLIALYVRYEYSYEKFIPAHARIFRLSERFQPQPGTWEASDKAQLRSAQWLKLDFPEVESTARIVEEWLNVNAGEVEYKEQVYTADPDFFRVFQFPAVDGDLAHALDAPDGIAISRTVARKYFGDGRAIGKVLELEKSQPDQHAVLHVTAVFEDLPGNSHFNFRFVVSGKAPSWIKRADSLPPQYLDRAFCYTYFRLRPGAHIARIEQHLAKFLAGHLPADQDAAFDPVVMPIAAIHLSPPARYSMKPRGNPLALRGVSIVGVIILLIALMNFVNLTTARSAQRAVEVGVRKLNGARRRDLWVQFTAESLLQVVLAMLVAVSLVELVLPGFCSLLDAHNEIYAAPSIRFDYWRDPSLALVIGASSLLVGVLAAAYPSLVLANLRPATVFRGVIAGSSAALLRRLLVLLQFAMLVGLIIATTVIHRQTDYVLRSALRIDTDQVVLYWVGSEPGSRSRAGQAFIDALPTIPGVVGVTTANGLPIDVMDQRMPFNAPGKAPVVTHVGMVDFNFFDFYRIPLLAGRMLERGRALDQVDSADMTREQSVILNETAARAFGFSKPQDAIGKTLTPSQWPFPGPKLATIVGVTADFPMSSVRRPVEPMLFVVWQDAQGTVSVRVSGDDVPATMARMDLAWKKFGPPRAQVGDLVESWYRDMYSDVVMQRTTLTLFSGCAIFLAALGLLGLSTFTVQRRTREIGIRKAMGASTRDILQLLLWAFSKPVLWASVIAWPVSAWLLHRWLEGFAYRVPLGWWWLPLSTLIALGIALLTVSVHSVIAARARPVAALRYE